MTRFTKADIDTHYDHYRAHPAVNVKVYGSPWNVKLPLALGSSAPLLEDGTVGEMTTHYTDPDFTHDWIDALDESTKNDIWDFVLEGAREYLQSEAEDVFGQGTKVYFEGRSGGWAIIDDFTEEDVEGWDAIAVGRWARFVKAAKAIVDDIPYQYVVSIYMNEFEAQKELRDAEMRELAGHVVGGH